MRRMTGVVGRNYHSKTVNDSTNVVVVDSSPERGWISLGRIIETFQVQNWGQHSHKDHEDLGFLPEDEPEEQREDVAESDEDSGGHGTKPHHDITPAGYLLTRE